MLEPISARFASSFSRNGISEAATDTSCFGDTSIRSTLSRGASVYSPDWRVLTISFSNALVGQMRVGLRHGVTHLLGRGHVDDLIGHLRVLHLAIGVSMKPYLFTRAKVASELIRPIFGPSGVSIGHIRP
jgi:hypothetical protein